MGGYLFDGASPGNDALDEESASEAGNLGVGDLSLLVSHGFVKVL